VTALFGDASLPETLDAACVGDAAMLIIATPDSYRARRVLEVARAANPAIEAVIRTHSDDEAAQLRQLRAGFVVMGERELARTMLHHVLRRFGVPPERARRLVEDPDSADLSAEADRR
jgi:monovalent cation:H+ antiporter-2, CPA2 family